MTRAAQRGLRFFRTPKGLMLIILVALLGVAAPNSAGDGPRLLAAGALAAAALDVMIVYGMWGEWAFPSGALLTGLFIGGLVDPFERVQVVVVIAIAAIFAKHIVRMGGSHVFNPAALGLVASSVVFGSGQSWWAALPDLGAIGVAAVAVSGWWIARRLNKLPMVATFLGAYLVLFTVTAIAGSPDQVSEVFRSPDLQAALFFAFFMLTDPPTSPVRYRDQAIYGALVAAGSYAVFMQFGVVYFLLAGLLAGNAVEAGRRTVARRRRRTRSARARERLEANAHGAEAARAA